MDLEEQLKKEAEEKSFEYIPKENTSYSAQLARRRYIDGYLDCAEPREKRIAEAKDIIDDLLYYVKQCNCERSNYAEITQDIKRAEKFLEE